MCCNSDTMCEPISKGLTYLRAVTVPIGILFVALCPTVNFWTQELPGAGVVRNVHLTFAAVLFAGGTMTETLRLYFLWCQSRAATIKVNHERSQRGTETGQQTGYKIDPYTPPTWSCFHFLSFKKPWEDKVLGTDKDVGRGIGLLRPWLILCLCVGLVAAGWSMLVQQETLHSQCRWTGALSGDGLKVEQSTKSSKVISANVKKGKLVGNVERGDKMLAKQGELVLSPVGTAFCPTPQVRHSHFALILSVL